MNTHRSQTHMRSNRSESGFSLIELVIAVGIVGIVLSIAIIGMNAILPTYRANQAMNQVFSQLRGARQLAITQRRNVKVQFTGTNSLQITEVESNVPGAGADIVFPPVTWEGGATYFRFAAIPDTPMGFGTCGNICIGGISGGPPTMQFTPTGTFLDGGNTMTDGTIFLGIAGTPMSARAVTILGATGRVRQYHWNGTTWEE
jgi:prepilin-type N-terminal cleavage/methylation domain-containing protein